MHQFESVRKSLNQLKFKNIDFKIFFQEKKSYNNTST